MRSLGLLAASGSLVAAAPAADAEKILPSRQATTATATATLASPPASPAEESGYVRFARELRPDLLSENAEIRERMARYWYFLTYPTGNLPDQPWERAREHVERHVRDAAPWPLEGPPWPPTTGRAIVPPGTNVWVEMGPRPLDSTGTTNNAFQYGITAGRLNVIVSDPVDRGAGAGDRAWLGFASGGLWRIDGIRSVTCAAGNCNTSGVTAVSLWDDRDLASQAISAIELDLVSDPSGDTLYVGTGDWAANDQFSAGIMKTTDGGATWTHLAADVFTPYSKVVPPSQANGGCVGCQGNRWNNQNIKAIEVDPNDPSTLLVGTRNDLYISHDSGATWQICGFGNFPTNPEITAGALNGFNRISSIHLDDTGAQTRAYVAVGYIVRRDTDLNGTFENANNGVYSFLVPSSGCPTWPGGFTTHFDGLPAGTGTTATGSTATGRIELAAHGSGAALTLYAQVADATNLDAEGTWVVRPNDAGWTDTNGNGVRDWRLLGNSGTANYDDCTGAASTTAQDWYDLHIAVHPTDDKQLYVGHVDLFKPTVNATYTSLTLNSASNLTNVYATTCGSYGRVHPDQHAFDFVELGVADPNYGNWVLVGNDGGIYLNTNAGNVNNWARLSAAGISTNQFYAGQVGMNFAGTDFDSSGTLENNEYGNPVDNRQWLLGGMQDNGCASWDSAGPNLQWTARGRGGDGMWTAFDSLGGTLSAGYWITESQNGGLACSSSGADGPMNPCAPGWAGSESQDWSTPVVMDQFHCTATQCRNALAAGDHVYASTAYGTPSWTRTTSAFAVGLPGRTDDGNPASYADGSIVALNTARTNPGGVVAGTDNGTWWWSGNVFTGANCTQAAANTASFSCTANAVAGWERIDAAGSVLPNRVVAGVAFAPDSDQVVYAALAGFDVNTPTRPGHIFRATRTAPNTWTVANKSGNLPDVPFMTVAVNPHNPTQVFAGSLWGFYYTDDVTAASPTWLRYMEGPLPNTPIYHFSIDRGPQSNPFASTALSAFTYGRGIYAIKLPTSGNTFCSVKPAAPTGAAVAALVANRLDVTWNDSTTAGVTSYRVYRATSSGGPYTQVGNVADGSPGVGGAGSYLFQDTTVSGGTTYYYVVRAFNGSCESLSSSEVSATAFGDCTIAPSFGGLQSVAPLAGGQGCGLRLAWNAASTTCGTALRYNVYRSTTSGFTPGPANLLQACVTGTAWDDTSAAADTLYHYVVRAEDGTLAGGGPCGNGNQESNTTQLSGSYSASGTVTLLDERFDTTADGSFPAGWTTGAFGGAANNWQGARTCSPNQSSPKILRYGATSCTGNYGATTNGVAVRGVAVPAAATNVTSSFYHRWGFESGFDGARLYLSPNGANFFYVGNAYLSGQTYNNTAGGLASWGGTQAAMVNTTVNLSQFCSDNTVNGFTAQCSGQTIHLGFNGFTDNLIHAVGWFVDNVLVTYGSGAACTAAPSPVSFFTATGKDTQVIAEWLNPATYSGPTRICRSTSALAADPSDAACPLATRVDEPGSAGTADSVTFGSLTNGQTQFLAAFVRNGAGAYSGRRGITGHPISTSSAAKWSFSTGAAALAAPLQSGAIGVFAGSNDRALYAMETAGAGAGTWPSGWSPAAMNGPAQASPLVLPASFTGFANPAAFVGSQDGFVYCFDATTGAGCSGWAAGGRSATDLGVLQATPMLYFAATPANRLLLVPTRNTTGSNGLYALALASGATAAGWPFTNTVGQGGNGQAIGLAAGPAFVDAANARAYFTTRARSGGSPNTVWAVSFAGGAPTLLWARAIGDVDGAITHDWTNNRLIVGTNGGALYALDPANGNTVWSRSFADGAVKDFAYYDAANGRLYFATTTRVWSIPASGATGSDWSATLVAPTRPLLHFGTTRTYVGACSDASCANGRLVELDSASAWASPKTYDIAGAGGLGAVTIDRSQSPAVAFAGSRSGRIYAVQLPLP